MSHISCIIQLKCLKYNQLNILNNMFFKNIFYKEINIKCICFIPNNNCH